MKRVIFVVVLFLLSFQVFSIGLATSKIEILNYVPGTSQTMGFQVMGTSSDVDIQVSQGPLNNVEVTELNEQNKFHVTFNFDETFIEPGDYILAVTVKEKPNLLSGGGMKALTSVSKRIKMRVHSYEKDVQISLSTPKINKGFPLPATLNVQSVGYPDIDSVGGTISIFDKEGNLLESITTEKKPLPSLSSVSFSHTFQTQNLQKGTYFATAEVTYDGKKENTTSNFLIGDLDLSLVKYSNKLNRGYNNFNATVENNWGNPVGNIYAKLFFSEKEVLHTPTISLPAWEQGILRGIINIDLEPGKHSAILRLFFEGNQKDENITLEILEQTATQVSLPKLNKPSTLYFPYLAVLGAIVMILILFFIWKGGMFNNDNKKEI